MTNSTPTRFALELDAETAGKLGTMLAIAIMMLHSKRSPLIETMLKAPGAIISLDEIDTLVLDAGLKSILKIGNDANDTLEKAHAEREKVIPIFRKIALQLMRHGLNDGSMTEDQAHDLRELIDSEMTYLNSKVL